MKKKWERKGKEMRIYEDSRIYEDGGYKISETGDGIEIKGEGTDIIELTIKGKEKENSLNLIEENLKKIELAEYEIFNEIFNSIESFSLTLDSDFGETDQVLGDIAKELIETFDSSKIYVSSFFSIEDKKKIIFNNGNIDLKYNENFLSINNGNIKNNSNEDSIDYFLDQLKDLKTSLSPENKKAFNNFKANLKNNFKNNNFSR